MIRWREPSFRLFIYHGDGSALLPHGGQIPIVWGLVLLGLAIIYGLPRLTRVVPQASPFLTLIRIRDPHGQQPGDAQ